MQVEIFIYKSSYADLQSQVNVWCFKNRDRLEILDIKPIRCSNNPSVDSLMVTYKMKEVKN